MNDLKADTERVGEEPEFLTWRMVADQLAEALRLTREYIGEDKLPPASGWSWYDAMQKYEYLKEDDAGSGLIAHARRELTVMGWYNDDTNGLHADRWADSLIAAVAEFTHYGHSGSTAGFGLGILEKLLMFQPLGPLSSDPNEWQEVTEYADGTPLWQNRRDGRCFSHDRGQTWYNLEDSRWHKPWWNLRAYLWRYRVAKLRSKLT